MEQALAAEGIDLVHIIGAKAGHEYTAAAKVEINRRIDSSGRRRPRAGARGGSLHHLDAALQPLGLGRARRPGTALESRPRQRRTAPRRHGQRAHHDRKRQRPDASFSGRPLPVRLARENRRSKSTNRSSRRRSHCPTDRGWPTSAKSPANGKPSPATKARRTRTCCTSGTACKDRSTMRFGTAF